MTDDQHRGEGAHEQGAGGSWERLPQGDYDDGATAFVQLPEGGIDALLVSDSPLAAPGHGYVPPTFTPSQGTGHEADGGNWGAPAEGAQWPAAPQEGAGDRFAYDPGASGQWSFQGTTAQEFAAPGHDVTGQWSIPVAGGDLPDESGEFTTSSLVEQWGGTPPVLLPGGARAPWATEAAGQPWPDQPQPQTAQAPDKGHAEPSEGAYEGPEGAYEGSAGAYQGSEGAYDGSAGAYEGPEGAYEGSEGAYERTYEDRRVDGAPEVPESVQEPSEPAEAPAVEDAPAVEAVPAPKPPAADREPAPEPAEARDSLPEPAGSAPLPEPTPELAHPHDEHPLVSYVLRVNGADRPVTDAWIGESLLYVLRERLGLAGAKDGCSQGECGACNIQVDGRLVASCLVPAVTAAGSEVRTVEGLAADGHPSDVQRALARCGAVQCGFCVPGMAMTVQDLLEGNPAPTELEARQALCGNLCRCSGYRGVLQAVQEVVAERQAHRTEGEPAPEGEEHRIPHQAGPGEGGVHPNVFEDRPLNEHLYGQDGGQA